MPQLANRTVLVTGAAGGFGQEMIRQFLEAGSRLVLTDLHDEPLREIARERALRAPEGEVVAVLAADLSTAEGCEALHRSTRETGVEIDVLVNNAGIGNSGYFHEIPAEEWERLMCVNLLAPMRLAHRFLPDMIARGRGHIVNISSIAGWVTGEGLAPYSASKFGLRGFGEALAHDAAAHGLKVTNVYPWFSRTPILDSAQYGSRPRREVPPGLATDPADVVREVLRGIREERLHVFPDPMARRLQWMKRFVPWVLPPLIRRMEKRTITAATAVPERVY